MASPFSGASRKSGEQSDRGVRVRSSLAHPPHGGEVRIPRSRWAVKIAGLRSIGSQTAPSPKIPQQGNIPGLSVRVAHRSPVSVVTRVTRVAQTKAITMTATMPT